MKWTELKAGTRLELRRLSEACDGAVYVSQLLEPSADGRCLLIAMPIHGCQYVAWAPGTRLRISLIEPGRGVWHFLARIGTAGAVGADDDRIRTYTVHSESQPARSQRRAHFRVDCLLEASFGHDRQTGSETGCKADTVLALPTDAPAAKPAEKPAQIRAITQNVSGGGACIIVDEPPAETGYIELVLPAGEDACRIVARCQVVRCESARIAGREKHRVSLKFTDISRKDQDALVRCLLRLQLRQKQQEA